MPPFTKFFTILTAATIANAYWLMGIENFITTERLDPIVNPGKVSGHVHSVLGGSNFRMNTNTASLRQSQCTSIPIPQDKSNYWFPHLYFQWANGSFSSLTGGAVIYYLFDDKPGTTTAFPDDFRMLSGNPSLRTYDANSFAQQAVTFLCLDFNGVTTRHNELPSKACPSGVRAQINFPNCWDGKNTDSSDHKSHVAFQATGPDSGGCKDPKFPVTLPRIFIEVYWSSNTFDSHRNEAMNKDQPFVFSHGDPTGYGYHADFINGWDAGVLQKAVDGCNCNIYGDPQCCADKGIFTLTKGKKCFITPTVDEPTTGMLPKLPGNNPVQPAGKTATVFADNTNPPLLSPVNVYTDPNNPAPKGQVTTPGSNNDGGKAASSAAVPSSSPVIVKSSSVAAVPLSSAVASSSVAPAPQSSSNAAPVTTTAPSSSKAGSGAGQNTLIAITSSSSAAAVATSPASKPSVVSSVVASSSAAHTAALPASSAVYDPYPYPPASGSSGSSGSNSGSSGSSGGSKAGSGSAATTVVVVPAPAPTSAASSSGSGSSGSSSSGSSSGSGGVVAPVAGSGSPGSGGVAAPSKGSNSTKNGTKCKHRTQMQKQLKEFINTYHQHADSKHTKGAHTHGHAKRVYSHDMSTGRRRFAQSRMQEV